MKVVGIDAVSSAVSSSTLACSIRERAHSASGSLISPPSRGALAVKGTGVPMDGEPTRPGVRATLCGIRAPRPSA